jgi:hypothetical protein
MTHCSDDDLVLHYYGELPEAEEHVAGCAECAARAGELAAVLASVSAEVPERDEHYGAQVWQRVQPHISAGRPLPGLTEAPRNAALVRPAGFWPAIRGAGFVRSTGVRWPLAAAATLTLLATGFLVGRISMPSSTAVAPTRVQSDDGDPQLARRVLLLTVADHLERSERVLTDVMNSPADLLPEQQWAADLVAANRLYRQDALDADESSLATVLDELERALLDIVHRPADASPADLDQIRQRIDSAALLFKVRVMSDELRRQQFGSDGPSPGRSTTPIS